MVAFVNSVPHKLTHMNLFVDGWPCPNTISEIELPKLTHKVEEHRGGGMNIPYPIEQGMEKLEVTFKLAEYDPIIMSKFGFNLNNQVSCCARGSLKAREVIPIAAYFRGVITSLDMGTWKAGDNTELTVKMDLTYYRLTEAEINIVEIDVPNMVLIVGGRDLLLEERLAILR